MRRFGLLILSLIVSLSPAMSRGGSYPDRPIRLVVGFGVGGPTDIPARFIADKLSEALGQRVFVENKPASGGIVATRDVIARPADGYTLLLCTHFEPINVAAYKDPGFRLSDLAPISLIAKYYYGLALSNAIPPTDIGSFIAYAKAHPGQVNYGTVGFGSAQEILARQLEKVTGITMNQVPFRNPCRKSSPGALTSIRRRHSPLSRTIGTGSSRSLPPAVRSGWTYCRRYRHWRRRVSISFAPDGSASVRRPARPPQS